MKRHLYLALIVVSNFIAFPLCSMAQSNLIDVVYLKNGSIIKGVIVEQVPGHAVKLQTADGSLFVFESSEIEKMTREAQATINALPSSPSAVSTPKDRDDWGRTYKQNMELAKRKREASIGLMSTGSVLVAAGATFIVISTDPTLIRENKDGYFLTGVFSSAIGIPFLVIGGALWSVQLKYRDRAETMSGGTAQLNPTFIRTESFSGANVNAGSAVGLQFTYRF